MWRMLSAFRQLYSPMQPLKRFVFLLSKRELTKRMLLFVGARTIALPALPLSRRMVSALAPGTRTKRRATNGAEPVAVMKMAFAATLMKLFVKWTLELALNHHQIPLLHLMVGPLKLEKRHLRQIRRPSPVELPRRQFYSWAASCWTPCFKKHLLLFRENLACVWICSFHWLLRQILPALPKNNLCPCIVSN